MRTVYSGFVRHLICLVRRTPAGPVLRIECAEGCRDGWPDAYDALLYSGPKQCNPKIAAKEQLRAAHRGRAPGMGRAIKPSFVRLPRLHSPRRGADGGVPVFVHPRLTTRVSAGLDVNFFSRWRAAEIGFSPIRESTVLPIVRSIGGKRNISEPWRYLQQSDCRMTKNSRRCAGSINFGSGIL